MSVIYRKYPKQIFAMWLGLVLVAIHIVMTFILWIQFSSIGDIHIEEIATPISTAYFISIVKWFIGNQGLESPRNEEERTFVGLPYLILIIMICTTVVAAHVGGALFYAYSQDMVFSTAELNRFYLFTETAFGGAFALVFSDLYERKRDAGESIQRPTPTYQP